MEGGKTTFWLRAGLALLILIFVGGLTTCLVAKLRADSVARDCKAQVKDYLTEVTNATEGIDSPRKIVVAVRDIKAPEFTAVPLGQLSTDYTAARKQFDASMTKVRQYTELMQQYAQVLEFYDKYKALSEKLATLEGRPVSPQAKSRNMIYLERTYELLKEMNDLIEKTSVSSDYAQEFVELGRVYDSMELNMEAVTFSIKLGNDAAYNTTYDMFLNAKAQVPRVEAALGSFIETVPAKITTARNDLKKYGDSL